MKRFGSVTVQVGVLLSICTFLYVQHLRQHFQTPEVDAIIRTWTSNFADEDEAPSASASPETDFSSLYIPQTLTDFPQQTSQSMPQPTPAPYSTHLTEQVISEQLSTDMSSESNPQSSSSEAEAPTSTESTTSETGSTAPDDEQASETPSEEEDVALDTANDEVDISAKIPKYINAIMSPENEDFDRLKCPAPTSDRYDYLKVPTGATSKKAKYLFALDLYQYAEGLPRLLGSVVEAIRFLGPHTCMLSVIEGRSTDGTYEILTALESEMEKLGAKYILSTSDINPTGEGNDRIQALAHLRNQALAPLFDAPNQFDLDATVIFINDVSLCMEDILELVHQKAFQKADMTCAMDWINDASLFYDVWISRQMTGDLFFEIPQNGGWEYAENLLWNDPEARNRLDHGRPFQVFACWNGAAAFTARPLLQHKVKFRSNREGECYLGEPVHFAKDMWKEGYGKIAVVPSVNLGYFDQQSVIVKNKHGSVSSWVEQEDVQASMIEWERTPPKHIKCVWDYKQPSWVLWNQ